MILLSLHTGMHDGAAAVFDDYRLLAAVQLERLTRRKGDGTGIPLEAMDEVLSIAGLTRQEVDAVVLSRASIPARFLKGQGLGRQAANMVARAQGREKHLDLSSYLYKQQEVDAQKLFRRDAFLADFGLRSDAAVAFSNHHLAHGLSAVFFTDWDDALIYTADGCGDRVHYSMRVLKDGRLDCLYGDDGELLKPKRVDSLGLAYAYCTGALGYRPNRHEGKLTGLAAYGRPSMLADWRKHFRINADGLVETDFQDDGAMRLFLEAASKDAEPADVAASVQALLEESIHRSVSRMLERTGAKRLALAGGVFANVRLNRLLCEETGIDEIFVCPGMGDEGLALGGALQFLLERDGLDRWLQHRYRLRDVYLGRDPSDALPSAFEAASDLKRIEGDPVTVSGARLAKGDIGAIYEGRMEFGPRALGARSILASPIDNAVNDSLNKRLERTEFMPFAPYIAEADAADVFDVTAANRYAASFMTITTAVKPEWHDRIPAVVHVDGTARPQVIRREDNALYYDVLADFKARTGLPCLVNTSFNAHEEPIINRPAEAIRALRDGRIDFLITRIGCFERAG